MDVLFVDDERPVLEQAKLFLEDLKDGLKVETTSSARDAIDKIKMKRYDAVVSDRSKSPHTSIFRWGLGRV
ncbi:MAG: response regulator, partial [Thermoplasmatota archaeon]